MAEGITREEKSLEELRKEITCAICQELYIEPKVLPCLHYYCKECILKVVHRADKGKPFSCPECCREVFLEDNVDELLTAFFIIRLRSTVCALERVHGNMEVKCEECSDAGNKAEAFCRQCAVFICGECVKQHKRMRSFASHEVVPLEDLQHGRARGISTIELLTKKCEVHEEPLIIYCFDCGTVICHHCTIKLHKDHNVEFSKIVAPDMRKNLLDELFPLTKLYEDVSYATETVLATKKDVRANGDSIMNSIRSSFDELQQILEKRKSELLQEVERKVQDKLEKLSVQEKTLQLVCSDFHHTIDYTEQCVSHCSDNEVVSLHLKVKRGIHSKIEEHRKSGLNMNPVEDADIGVEVGCGEVIQQLCHDKARITQLAVDPVLCTVTGDGIKMAEVHKIAEVSLTVRLTNRKKIRRGAVVESQLKSVVDGSVVKCDVNHLGHGEYNIKYTPIIRGRHELSLSVDGLVVEGCPFHVFVFIPLAQIGEPVSTWKDLPDPKDLPYARAVTLNSLGEIIVLCNHGIVKLEKDGKKSILVTHSASTLNWMKEVSTDQDGNIYCTDISSNKVLKCNKTGGDVKIYELKQQVKNPGHYGITVLKDEVLICERGNSGSIMVYDRELNFKRCIRVKNASIFHSVCGDNNGHLYITDHGKNVVHVVNSNGDPLQTPFGSDCDGVQQLDSPYGLCVHGELVYVVNYVGNSVSMFSTEGKYLSSFGQKGSGDGDFDKPCDVCVDEDGFVYVADDVNCRVQCF